MEPFDIAQTFIDLCEKESSLTSRLTAGLQRAMEALGFPYFACCAHVDPLHPPPQALMIHNYPAAWVQHYSKDKLYELDPVLQRAGSDPMPFFWDTVFQAKSVTAAQRRMLADATDVGVAHGYTLPIHLSWLPGAVRTSCSIVPDASSVGQLNYFMVGIMVTDMYAVLNRALLPRPEMAAIRLSPRERQCLTLVLQGKDDWAIGRLMGLSPHTVHFYIKRVMQRLGVRSRVRAAFLALLAGQIPIGDVPATRNNALHSLKSPPPRGEPCSGGLRGKGKPGTALYHK